MWHQCKTAARWGAFNGMLLALISELFFLMSPAASELHFYASMSAHGSPAFVEAAYRDFNNDTDHMITWGLDSLDYVNHRIYRIRPPVELIRIPYAVLTVPLTLMTVCMALPVLMILLCWAVPASSGSGYVTAQPLTQDEVTHAHVK